MNVFQEIMVISTTLFDFPFDHALKRMLDLLLSEFYSIVFPFAALVIIVGILANVLQFGVLFSTEPVKPKFERINPIGGFKRLFSIQNILEAIKSIIKVIVLSAVVYFVLRKNMESLIRIPYCGIDCLKGLLEHLAALIAIYITPFIIFLAIVDYILQKRIFLRSQQEHCTKRNNESRAQSI